MMEMEISSNIYDRVETHRNCTVQILTNSITGEQSVGWWHNDSPPCGYCEEDETDDDCRTLSD